MTPTQLRAYAAVARHGSVKRAAAELAVSESAVSLHIGQLRRELGDQLFNRTAAGLAFTPGGLRLARRAIEMLGLQDRTIREVSQAGRGRRLLRIASSSLFAEHAAPGLIELFTSRGNDLDVEMIVCHTHQFQPLLDSRAVDVAIGPKPADLQALLTATPFLNYQLLLVTGPDHPDLATMTQPGWPSAQTWLLGPAAVGDDSVLPRALEHFRVPESQQRIFQSNAAALEEAQRGNGLALAVAFTVTADLTGGRLVRVPDNGLRSDAVWNAIVPAGNGVLPAAAELIRFVSTPRAIQAMLRGSGVNVGHFRPSVHVTLWS